MHHHAKPKSKIFSLRTVFLFFTALIVGFSLYNFNAQKLLGDKLPMPLGYGFSVVLSGSMEPTLSVDDLVLIKKTKDVKVDDIVVYQQEGSLVIHRVIEKDKDTIITKGDYNNSPDQPIKTKNIKGVMIASVPYVGIIINFIKQPFVVILLLILVILFTEKSFRKEKDKDSDEIEAIKLEIEKLTAQKSENTENSEENQ